MQTWAILRELPAGTVPVFNFHTEKILTPLLNFLPMRGKGEEGNKAVGTAGQTADRLM
jgi:hypothetical protein